MIAECSNCGNEVNTWLDFCMTNGLFFCDRECLEQWKTTQREEQESCKESESHTENKGNICPKCGQEIKWDSTKGN